MSSFPATTNIVWALATLAKPAVGVLAFRQRQAYPCFNIYIWVSFALTIALWAIAKFPTHYFYGYYYGLFVIDLLLVLVVCEFARLLFWPLKILPREIRIAGATFLFGGTIVAIALWRLFPSAYPDKIAAIARTVDRSASILMIAGIAVIWAVAWYLQILWRSWAAGIAIGITCNVTLSAFWNWATNSANDRLWVSLQWFPVAAYIVAEIIWINTFLRPEAILLRPMRSKSAKRENSTSRRSSLAGGHESNLELCPSQESGSPSPTPRGIRTRSQFIEGSKATLQQ